MNRLTSEKAEARYPDMVRGQRWRGFREKYKFLCTNHGVYKQEYRKHAEHGCYRCGVESSKAKHRIGIEEAQRRQPDMVLGQTWTSNDAYYKYRCEIHGIYKLSFQYREAGVGCPECRAAKKASLAIEKAERRYPDMVKGQVWRGNHSRYWFICEKHGKYEQEFNCRGSQGCRCRACSESHGERAVAEILVKLNLSFEREKWFASCRSFKKKKTPFRFDFYLASLKTLIEYHGIQHYTGIHRWGGMRGFREIQHRDRLKKNWCRRNGYRLITIYYRVKTIESYLTKRLGLSQQIRKAA